MIKKNEFSNTKVGTMTQTPFLTAPVRVMTPIIKVVGDNCNLRCNYCFFNHLDRSAQCVMSSEILNSFVTQYMAMFTGPITFNWHGGEPLLAGLPFFERVVEMQKRNLRDSHVVRNTIQTNGTLITDPWAEFLKIYEFGVGVSLDGRPHCHDRFRRDSAGRGTSENALRGILLLRDHGIEPGIIQTVVRSTINDAEESFRFIVEEIGAKHFGVNVFNDWSGGNPAMAGQSLSNRDFTRFFRKYIDLWLERKDPDLKIRDIESLVFGVLGKRGLNCSYNGTCTAFFTVDWDGTVLPACERLSDHDDIVVGSLPQSSLVDILNSPERLDFAHRVNAIHPDCRGCNWYHACHNGCTMHRFGGISGKYYYCEARKELFSYLRETIESMDFSLLDRTTP